MQRLKYPKSWGFPSVITQILLSTITIVIALQAQEMGASGTMIGLIFGIYPLVVFLVAPLIGVFVSIH